MKTNRVVILGACGGIGSVATRALLTSKLVDQVILADINEVALGRLEDELADNRVSSKVLDVTDRDSLLEILGMGDVAVNCVGPFYKFGPPILEASIDAGTDYVDICDDLDATQSQLKLDNKAKDSGVRALIGIGSSPGLANVLVRFANDQLLDEVVEVDICHVHGGEAFEGPAVLKHRIHAMVNQVPVFVDGTFHDVMMLEDSGARFAGDVDFGEVGVHRVYPYPHPETITLPKTFPSLKRVTNRGCIFPRDYFELTMAHVRNGLASVSPIEVNGSQVIPLEFMVHHLMAVRPSLLSEAKVGSPAGCLRVEVAGRKDGQWHQYVFLSGSQSDGAGAGTGIPAALGAMLMLEGNIKQVGVNPPEAVVDPAQMIALAGNVVRTLGVGGQSSSINGLARIPLRIIHTGPDGTSQEVPFEI